MEFGIRTEEGEKSLILHQAADPLYEMGIDGELFSVKKLYSSGNKTSFSIGDEFHTVYLSEDTKDQAYLSLDGHIFEMKRKDVLSDSIVAAGQESMADGDQVILAPMPGKVIKVPVSIGESVTAGQTLIVVEAMKMQSEFKATADRIVREILVKEGDTVSSHQLMMKLE